MVAVRDRVVAATRAVDVACATNVRRAMRWITGVHAEHVFDLRDRHACGAGAHHAGNRRDRHDEAPCVRSLHHADDCD